MFIQFFDALAIKLLFFKIICRRKVSEKILMKKKRELRRNALKFLCNFHVFGCKIMQILLHILINQTFSNKMKHLLMKFGWKNVEKYAIENNLSNIMR